MDNNCSKRKVSQSSQGDEVQPINPELFTNSASHRGPSSPTIQTPAPVPISDIRVENSGDLAGSTTDTVTPNPQTRRRTRRKCSKRPEKESESGVRDFSSTHPNNRRANEPSREITTNLCRRFPGLPRLFCGDDDGRLGQNNRHENDAEITDFRESGLCPKWIGNNPLRNGLCQNTRASDVVKDPTEKVRDHISWTALLYRSRKDIAHSKCNGHALLKERMLNGTGHVTNAMPKIVCSMINPTDLTLCELIAFPRYGFTNVKSNIIFSSSIYPMNITLKELITFPQYEYHIDKKLDTVMSSNFQCCTFLKLSDCETMSDNYFVSDFGVKNGDTTTIKSSYYDCWKTDKVFEETFPFWIMKILENKCGRKPIKKNCISISSLELFPRSRHPTDTQSRGVVCQLHWRDLTQLSYANFLALTQRLPLQLLEVPFQSLQKSTHYSLPLEFWQFYVSKFSNYRSQSIDFSPPVLFSFVDSEHLCVLDLRACLRRVAGIDSINEPWGPASLTMDWMQATGTDAVITDDQLTTALQHLLVSVEKGIERLEWNGVPKPRAAPTPSEGPSTFPRCCHVRGHPVDTRDTSVQTAPQEDAPEEDPLESTKSEDGGLVVKEFACVRNDSEVVSVVRKNYVHTTESIATQTSSGMSPSKVPVLEKPPDEIFVLPPLATREEDPDDGYCEHVLTHPATISQVDPDLLHSGVALLPGCRDAKGRSVVIISSDTIKDGFQLSSCQLAQLLLYFHTIPKKEVIGKGFLILIDASKHTEDFWSALDETFCLIEANLATGISEVLVLFEESEKIHDSCDLFPTSRIQFDTLSSQNQLLSFIPQDQILCKYGGDYIYDHQEWISFRKFLEPFINGCRLSGRHLVCLLEELRGSRLPVSSTLTHQMIEQQKRNVRHTFHDEQLRHLEEEGDTILRELQSYRTKSPHNHDYRDNLERTNTLYDELRKAMAKLARLADKRLNRLEECLQLKTFQEESSQVLSWLCRKGHESLERHQAVADSLGAIKQQEEEFEKFYFLAMRQIEKGNDLLEEVSTFSHESCLPNIQEEAPSEAANEGGIQELATSLRQHLGSFSEKLEGTRERIEDTAKCYQLMDKSYEWALEAMRFVSNMGITSTESADGILRQIRCLQDYSENHLRVPEDTFTEMLELAAKLGNEKLLEQCKVVKLRCEETVELIKARQVTLQKVRQQLEADSLRGPCWEAEDASQTPRTMRSHSQPMNTWLPAGTSTPYPSFSCHQRRRSTGGPMGVTTSQRYGSPIGSYTAFPSSYYPSAKDSYHMDSFCQEREDRLLNNQLITEDLTAQGPVASISKTFLDIRYRSGHSSSSSSSSSTSSKDTFSVVRRSARNSALGTEETRKSIKKLPRRCQMWQVRDEALEKAKAEVREQTALLRVEKLRDDLNENRSESLDPPSTEKISRKSLPQPRADFTRGPVPVNTHLITPTAPSDTPDSTCKEEVSNDAEAKSKKTLMLIMKELIQTERDYVKSLEYIIENYIPELLREDIPQALRGQRNVVFGNIEKIYEFHFQYFLHELEHCESSPFTVGQCFLDFQQQFYLYALYNKNKPKSDGLMSEYGNPFFRKKQLELQDKMDLASYLLKPVQRMGKYALLLKQLLKECPEREKEHKALKEAEEMVRFQLRHGNDLLAMDALKDCDVNVKEQGLLLRQDEFIVWQGRSRKCMRHVFLFEDLILFSKARRDPQRKGYEMYQYKHSIKTTDMGMTEQIGDSPTKFEIWFRKRKLNDTFLLQAPNPEVKAAWVSEIRGILFDQAVNNKKNRLAEMSSMGIGNKPCLDIKPSEDQISDRSISIHQLARAPRFRNSIAVSPYDVRNNRNSVISVTSSSSSGSSQSSFSFYGALNLGFEPGDSPRQLHRSLTQQSQCSTESGFCTDVSTAGDSPESEQPRHKRAERSDSLLSSDSLATNVSPSDIPYITKLEQSLEENITTSM